MEENSINDLLVNVTMSLGDLEELAEYLDTLATSNVEPTIARDVREKFNLILDEIEREIRESMDEDVVILD